MKRGYWPWKEHPLTSREIKTRFMDVISLDEKATKYWCVYACVSWMVCDWVNACSFFQLCKIKIAKHDSDFQNTWYRLHLKRKTGDTSCNIIIRKLPFWIWGKTKQKEQLNWLISSQSSEECIWSLNAQVELLGGGKQMLHWQLQGMDVYSWMNVK